MARGAELDSVYHPPSLAGQSQYVGGIYYDEHGFPDFTPYSEVNVRVELTGSRYSDEQLANQLAGFNETPSGYSWHHHQDGQTMMLVPTDIHKVRSTPHTGGFATANLSQ
jgi:hypothetical protein